MPRRPDDGDSAESVITRLNALRRLSQVGTDMLKDVICDNLRHADRGQDLIVEGDRIESIRILLSGWLCRSKTLADGRKQIVSFAVPGDCCDAYGYLLGRTDHSISTLTPVIYADIKIAVFEALLAADKSVAEAIWRETLVGYAIAREWILNLGRRSALESVAHLICELCERLQSAGLVDNGSFEFPVTQTDAADAVGLSVVHMNRTLQELRGANLIMLRGKSLTILDYKALKNVAMFSPNYLHCQHTT